MTIKQCNSCKHAIRVKELGEMCGRGRGRENFMKSKVCKYYDYGEVNQQHKDFFRRIGKEYPFTEIR